MDASISGTIDFKSGPGNKIGQNHDKRRDDSFANRDYVSKMAALNGGIALDSWLPLEAYHVGYRQSAHQAMGYPYKGMSILFRFGYKLGNLDVTFWFQWISGSVI